MQRVSAGTEPTEEEPSTVGARPGAAEQIVVPRVELDEHFRQSLVDFPFACQTLMLEFGDPFERLLGIRSAPGSAKR